MYNRIKTYLSKKRIDKLGVCHITLNEVKIGLLHQGFDTSKIGCIGHHIQTPNLVIGMMFKPIM